MGLADSIWRASFLGKAVGSIAVSEKDAAGSKCMPGGALVTSWATQIPSIRSRAMSVPSFEETAPLSGGDSWGRHFVPVRLHDPPGAMHSTLSNDAGS